jgi:hypothetical protein
MSGGGGKGADKPTDREIKRTQIYGDLVNPISRAIQDARRLHENGGQTVLGLNRRQWEGVEGIEDAASRVGSSMDEPLEYATWLSQGKNVGDAPGQEYLQSIYRNGASTAGYGTQENILRNLMSGNGAGYGTQEQILGQAMGTDNLGYLRNTAGGGMLGGNPQLDAVLGDMNRGTTQAYQKAIGSLEGGMSRAGQMGGSVESQLKARENEGLARALSANEAQVRYGDYQQERGYQQQAGMAMPDAFAREMATRQGAAGQLNSMEANRINQQQGAAGQLHGMDYQKLMAEMQAAQQAGSGYRQDIGQALQAGGMMPALGQAQFMPGQQLMQTGEFTRAANERQANAPWESFERYLSSLGNISNMTNPGAGAAALQQGPGAGQQAFGNLMQLGGLGLGAASVFGWSDRRLKTDIEPVGNGLYRWRYIWGGPLYEGPMAQDVQAVAPELVGEVDGYLTIPASMIRRVG